MIKIIYIAGDGRSGSTLLDSILNNIDRSISVGECHRFWIRFYEGSSKCGCNSKIVECKLWSKVDRRIKESFPEYDPTNFREKVKEIQLFKNYEKIPNLLKSAEWDSFRKIIPFFYETIAEVTNSRVIIDSSKSMSWAYVLQNLNFADLHILHLERSIVSVANSWKKEVRLPEYEDEIRMMPIKSNWVIAKSWLKIKHMARRLKKNYIFIPYESFCMTPEVWLAKLSYFIDENLPLNNLMSLRNHAIGGNPMRSALSENIEIKKPSTNFKNLSKIEIFLYKRIQSISNFF